MNPKIAVVGLGYVGLPVAVSFGQKLDVIGFDIDATRVKKLMGGVNPSGEVPKNELISAKIHFTTDPTSLQLADFIIVTVPTPIDSAKRPDLRSLKKASEIVGSNLKRGATVVFESTVFPCATEDICIPILEKFSGLKAGVDFKVGYSPERINPGDKNHTFTNTLKVVSGLDKQSLESIADMYSKVVTAGVHRVSSIKIAEAAKIIENTQRDLNVALMNELAILFNKLGINTAEVLEAAATKWNFLPFEPGLVGGHCIGVDPYYLTHKAEEVGYNPQVILAGRRINDSMGKYIAEQTVKCMIKAGKAIKDSKVLVLGFTFKENISDTRNTKVADVCRELEDFGINVFIYDPKAEASDVEYNYGYKLLTAINEKAPYDGIILAVKHRQFNGLSFSDVKKLVSGKVVLIDVKGMIDPSTAKSPNILYWRL